MDTSLKYLLFFILSSAQISLFAGEPKVKLTWGQEYEMPKKHMDAGFVGNMKDGFIQIGHRYGKSLSLQQFSPSLKLIKEKLIDLKAMPKGYMTESFVTWNDKTYWLFSTWEKKEEQEHLYAQEIDVKKGDLTGKPIELIHCDKVNGSLVATGFYKFAKADKFKISFSSDTNKLFVYVMYAGDRHDEFQQAGIWVFDNNFKAIWSKDHVKMPYGVKKMQIKDTQGDRDGNLMFLAKVYNDDSRKDIRDDKPNFHFEIIKFSASDKGGIAIPFSFENKYVAQLVLMEDAKGQTVCTGYYGNQEKNGKLRRAAGKVDGAFLLRLDNVNNKLVNIQKGFYEIPNEIFKEYETEKAVKKMERKEDKGEDLSATSLDLRHVVFKDDGSILILGEEYYVVVTVVSNGKSSYTTYHYHYNYIIAQYIDAAGNLVYTKKIPKNQIGNNTTFGLGFKLLPYNGSDYVFFLDNMKNLSISPDEVPAVHTAGAGGVLMAVRIDEVGKMQKAKIFDTREEKEKIDIISADQIGPNTLISRTWNKKTSKICLINII